MKPAKLDVEASASASFVTLDEVDLAWDEMKFDEMKFDELPPLDDFLDTPAVPLGNQFHPSTSSGDLREDLKAYRRQLSGPFETDIMDFSSVFPV